ncbi:NAD(P)-binding protein [Rhodocollybia butyracea]|uniref:NAD(P)-binding protein n=1 Tax=Rhodocollybia butyracea TaxID=206335 RepID=A0A9P5U5L4_9AGAR|nr:NAD(P)-binding protein [Rhodocollybia butyracea]
MDLFSLIGKTVLITGASRGIGRACAIALAQAGANICLVLRPPSNPSQDAFAELKDGEDPYIIYADISDTTSVKSVFPRALKAVPGEQIDILVNCAGIQRRAPSVEFSESFWDDVLNTNLKSPFILAQAAGRHMVPRKSGKIINFCSLLTFQGGLTVPAYAASKGGLGQLTKALSNEWSSQGVHVNGIAPGYIETDMNEALLNNPTRLQQLNDRIPAQRWGTPRDFAGPVVFLASQASNYVCGEVLVVDGGWMGR